MPGVFKGGGGAEGSSSDVKILYENITLVIKNNMVITTGID